jgi:DNA adenine methylase
MNNIQKPILKWVGGKTQMIDEIIKKFPKNIQNYHELFLGGGSVLFALLSLKEQNIINIEGQIYAYDLNKNLINLYIDVRDNPKLLYKYIEYYSNQYQDLEGDVINRNPISLEEAKTSKESYYYWLRDKFNKMDDSIQKSALFLILNKTCFRGIYREGPNGYNVPYGHYKNISFISKDELKKVSNLVKDVNFIHCDFKSSLERIKQGDFAYFDPPYAPENQKSFVGYTSNGFDINDHIYLFKKIKDLSNDIKFVLSNSKVPLVIESFKDYTYQEITARRAINSKKPDSTTSEVIIYN